MQHTNPYRELMAQLPPEATLVAVSKTKPVEAILELYAQGQRDFGENYVQELVEKEAALPKDIRWHFIGHLQTNKVKQIAPFVHLIHAVESQKLLDEINKQGRKNNRTIDVLLQLHISGEETKHGLQVIELVLLVMWYQAERASYSNVRICGLMGMAGFTEDEGQVRKEFQHLRQTFTEIKQEMFSQEEAFSILSMGMSGDYKIALDEGSNMLRIGSLLFGART